MSTQASSSSLAFLFFLVPLILPLLVGGILQRLNERLEEDATPSKKLSSRERAGDVADQHAQKVNRERARRDDASTKEEDSTPATAASPKAALAEAAPAEFEIPADFNLAEYSGREASPTA